MTCRQPHPKHEQDLNFPYIPRLPCRPAQVRERGANERHHGRGHPRPAAAHGEADADDDERQAHVRRQHGVYGAGGALGTLCCGRVGGVALPLTTHLLGIVAASRPGRKDRGCVWAVIMLCTCYVIVFVGQHVLSVPGLLRLALCCGSDVGKVNLSVFT